MRAYIGLGSNVGDRRGHLEEALDFLRRKGVAIEALSSIWETEPVDTVEGGWFLNMVARVRTGRTPSALLALLQEAELRAGRRRGAPNAPRELDLDLLLAGDHVIESDELSVPHPRMWQRRFVLEPLAELDPGLRDPRGGPTVEEARALLQHGPRVQRLDRPFAACSPTKRPPIIRGIPGAARRT